MAPRRQNVHPFLNFEELPSASKKEYKHRLKKLEKRKIGAGSYIDWEKLELDMASRDWREVEGYVVIPANMGSEILIDEGWKNVFSINEDIYTELVFEFFSTYHFCQDEEDEFNYETLQFRLGGEDRRLTLVEFARSLRIHPGIQNHPDFDEFIDGGMRDYTDNSFWGRIAGGNFSAGNSRGSQIRDPLLKMFHRLVATTINARSHGIEKVNSLDLTYLNLIARKMTVNIPFILANYLTFSTGRKDSSSIMGGQYITRLAYSFGILSNEVKSTLTKLQPMESLDCQYWKRIGLMVRSGGVYSFPDRHNWGGTGPLPMVISEAEEETEEEEQRHTAFEQGGTSGTHQQESHSTQVDYLHQIWSNQHQFMTAHNHQNEWFHDFFTNQGNPNPFPPSFYPPPPPPSYGPYHPPPPPQ